MSVGHLTVFRKKGQSLWIEIGDVTVQCKLTDAGGRYESAWCRIAVCAPDSVRIHREEEWIGGDSPPRRQRFNTPRAAIMDTLIYAAQAVVPTESGPRTDMTALSELAFQLMAELKRQGLNIA